MNVIVNTSVLTQNRNELKREKNYYQNKKGTFTSTSFGATGQLSKFLNKINTTYNTIAQNIENISEYLGDYINDVEGLENRMSNGSGNIKAGTVSSVVNRYRNSINQYSLNSNELFKVQKYKMSSSQKKVEKTSNPNTGTIKSALTKAGTSVLSFLKGIGDAGEALGDKVGAVASNIATLFENGKKSYEKMENVKANYSDEWYKKIIEKSSLDKFAGFNSSFSKISKGIGNEVGKIATGVTTAGLNNIAMANVIGKMGLSVSGVTTALTAANKSVAKTEKKQFKISETQAAALKAALNALTPANQQNRILASISDKLNINLQYIEGGKIVPNFTNNNYGPTKAKAEAIANAKKIEAETKALEAATHEKIEEAKRLELERQAKMKECLSWQQSDSRWGSIRLGGGPTIGDVGCLATSVAKLIQMSGADITIEGEFNPGTMVQTLNKHNGFTSGGGFTWTLSSVSSNFKTANNNVPLSGSREQKVAKIKDYLDQGYYIALKVQDKSLSNGRQHWVAVTGVTDNDVIISDSSSNATLAWSGQYNPNEAIKFACFEKKD